MARTVLGDNPNCLATLRTAALSQASPTASSKRLLKGALLGNCGTFSVFTPQSGHCTRYSSTTTVVRNSDHGRSRTSRSYVSYTLLSFRPHPEQTNFRLPRFLRTHNFSVLADSFISCRYTRYPGHPKTFVQSVSRILRSVPRVPQNQNPHLCWSRYRFLLRALFFLRRSLQETDEFKRRKTHLTGRQILVSLANSWRVVITGMLLTIMTTVSFYMITAYTPTFGSAVLHLASRDGLLVTVCVAASNLFWLPVMGALSDRVGRKPLLVACTLLTLITAYPALAW